jgi:hypothetical protein
MDVGTIFSGGVDLDCTLTSAQWHHFAAEKGWGIPLVMGLIPSDLAKGRASFFFVTGHSALGELFFPTLA